MIYDVHDKISLYGEYLQLYSRLQKLNKYINYRKARDEGYYETEECAILTSQKCVMEKYAEILEKRLNLFGIQTRQDNVYRVSRKEK